MTPHREEQPFTLSQMAPKRRWRAPVIASAIVLAFVAGGSAVYAYGSRADQPAATVVQPSTSTPGPSPLSHQAACSVLLPLLQRVVDVADGMLANVPPQQAAVDALLNDFRVNAEAWPVEMRSDIDRVVNSLRHMRAGRLDTVPLGEAGIALAERCKPYVRQ